MNGQATIGKRAVSARRCLKGQSAIEYLMTYGWAILALVIIVGLLAYYGMGSSNSFVSEECSLGSNLPCTSGVFVQGDQTVIAIGLVNGFAYKVNISQIAVTDTSDSSQATGFDSGVPLDSGSNHTFSGNFGKKLSANSVAKYIVNITYSSCAPESAVTPGGCSDSYHTISGKITARVIQG